jgi:hypothetical protein
MRATSAFSRELFLRCGRMYKLATTPKATKPIITLTPKMTCTLIGFSFSSQMAAERTG